MVRDQGHVVDIVGGHHDVPGGAVHVFKPLEEAGVLEGHHPYQLVPHLLNHRGSKHHLAAQTGILAHLLVRQLPRQILVHDGQLI